MTAKGGVGLKISINIVPGLDDTEISVSCGKLTPEIEKLIATLQMSDNRLTASLNGEIHILDLDEVIYIDAVDRKTFIYTQDKVYESDFKLYELEGRLSDSMFFRVSKSCIVNLRRIKSLRDDIERRIRLTMDNGEQLIASRNYADELRIKLGVK